MPIIAKTVSQNWWKKKKNEENHFVQVHLENIRAAKREEEVSTTVAQLNACYIHELIMKYTLLQQQH